ncbi:MAG: glucose 1-dehydrogenase [Streptosporangiales bacterium]|nr:glucose 1-dehydrogenase [Streptosporangiales bacterium]
MGRLDGKVALISGGARGMGESHVRAFVAEGARVVFGDVLDDKGKEVAASLGDAARYVHHDVTSPEDWSAAVAAATDAFGRLDVLVNNAGILKRARIEDMAFEEFRRVIEVNTFGQWLGMKTAYPALKASGGGSIVNISSIEGLSGAAGLSAYSASKFAVRGMTKSAAQEFGPDGIRVNSVHPGAIITDMLLGMADDMGVGAGGGADDETIEHYKRFVESIPLRNLGEAKHVTSMVLYLASDESKYSTGSEFTVDGGILAGPGY